MHGNLQQNCRRLNIERKRDERQQDQRTRRAARFLQGTLLLADIRPSGPDAPLLSFETSVWFNHQLYHNCHNSYDGAGVITVIYANGQFSRAEIQIIFILQCHAVNMKKTRHV